MTQEQERDVAAIDRAVAARRAEVGSEPLGIEPLTEQEQLAMYADRRQGDRRTGEVGYLYVATFDSGRLEKPFFAQSDEHAQIVAHDVARRFKVPLDAVQRQEAK